MFEYLILVCIAIITLSDIIFRRKIEKLEKEQRKTSDKFREIEKHMELNDINHELIGKNFGDLRCNLDEVKHSIDLVGGSMVELVATREKDEERLGAIEEWKESTERLISELNVPDEKERAEEQAMYEKVWEKYVDEITGYGLDKAYAALKGHNEG